MLIVEKFKVGPLETNCYLLVDVATQKAAIVDPGGGSSELDEKIYALGAENVEYIFMTHGHFDHIRKATRYKQLTGAKLAIGVNEADFTKDRRLNLCRVALAPFEADILLKDGDVMHLGETKLKVLETPGHTVGGVCLVAEDCIFTGDTLMHGTVGRCDLATGDMTQMMRSIERLSALSRDYKIYPGHGPETTLREEMENNVYFRRG